MILLPEMDPRGIGNYGDYYTPERFVPASKEATKMPWFVIYPLGSSFSYESDASKYKGTKWIIQNLVDIVAKGGNFMAGVGPSGTGSFSPTAITQLKEAGQWLQINGEGIYGTRPRPGTEWAEGNDVRFTCSKDGRALYCFVTEWPGKTLRITSVDPRPIQSVEMLGFPGTLKFSREATDNFSVSIPDELQDPSHRRSEFAWGFKLSYAT
jgi:alpha-L-fucosidase